MTSSLYLDLILIRPSHLLFNIAYQLLFGVPLELVHRVERVMPIYLIGIIFGMSKFDIQEWPQVLCELSIRSNPSTNLHKRLHWKFARAFETPKNSRRTYGHPCIR